MDIRTACLASAAACLVAGLPVLPSSAQQRAAMPVIVVFEPGADFRSFAAAYRADDRAQANPAAWDYLDRGVAGFVQTLERDRGFRADHVYSAALRGFAARLTAQQIAELQDDPDVAHIEPDGTMVAVVQTLPWGIDRIDADLSSTQAGDGAGTIDNVRVYVIDTGIDVKHADLRVVKHVNFASGPNTDCNGHGTHVAGTAAAKDNASDVVGVAPGAPLVGVKVLDCAGTGSTSGVIKGVDWVTANAVKPAAANMSLGGGASQALDDAVRRSADSGVFYSVAAGNSGADACSASPARAGTHDGVLTTAATDSSDLEPSWSNYGFCVDLWAPGVRILSTRKGGGTATLSGTSMAAPHAGGTAALYLSVHTAASAADVENALKGNAHVTGTTSKDGRAIELVYAGRF
jgi:subtilisin family serine protease